MRLGVYTDVSNTHWAAVVTQIPLEDVEKAHADKTHEPLALVPGHFNCIRLEWSTLETEAFGIMASVEKVHWLASCPEGFDLFTDHNKLIFIFDPIVIMPDLSQRDLRKVLRWAVHLSF